MTAPGTGTLARTATITMADVRHVMWRIESDLRVLRVQHSMITAEHEENVMHDLSAFVYRSYFDQIEFRFVSDANGTATYRVLYTLSRNWSGDDDDDSGGLRYRDLRGSSFTAVGSYSDAWRSLTADARAAFRAGLKLSWGPAPDVANGPGAWMTADRSYGSGGLGAQRSVFRTY